VIVGTKLTPETKPKVETMLIIEDYDDETRNCAAMTIIEDLLSLATSKAQKAELAVKILGHDPREE
jgi:hypothetical protein